MSIGKYRFILDYDDLFFDYEVFEMLNKKKEKNLIIIGVLTVDIFKGIADIKK